MKYEVVELKEKTVVGLTARTSNQDENMTKIIGSLWQKFYGDGVYESIPDKQNDCSIGLYSNYNDGASDAYDVTVGCEVSEVKDWPVGIDSKTIAAGKYARFVVRGHAQTAVADFWTKLWGMDLNRKFGCDFEEYQSEGDLENSEIHIYISLKD
ncbi:AraC family transcriptional regulator [Acetobacterium fimetarium]|uniref:AraC family transcriptional regulator n=1 Tax=Acetobacterium fimetarium TaxID=52691 RepID=A0ABR6WYB6_9FIRM|nr:GyrI-like domain-containing protein [Acetobacterium fimetarium]MBC3805481.1 AraC family transcriptional regulator [Acetobacterium fimetarium]